MRFSSTSFFCSWYTISAAACRLAGPLLRSNFVFSASHDALSDAPTFSLFVLRVVHLLVVPCVIAIADDASVAQLQLTRRAKHGRGVLLLVLFRVVVEALELLEVLLLRINARGQKYVVVRHARVALVEHVRSHGVGALEAVIAADADAAHGNLAVSECVHAHLLAEIVEQSFEIDDAVLVGEDEAVLLGHVEEIAGGEKGLGGVRVR